MVKNVLFDLDGTLLPLDMTEFINCYFPVLAKKLSVNGTSPEKIIENFWAGTKAMFKNDGTMTNEQRFREQYDLLADTAERDYPLIEEYYRDDFIGTKAVMHPTPKAAQTVKLCRELGLNVALATSPVFPMNATEQRIEWAGLDKNEFELISSYENFTTCKPNPDYYMEFCRLAEYKPEECLMVGNDPGDDMVAETIGMKVFLLNDYIYNPHGIDCSAYPQGSFEELWEYIKVIND